MRINGSAAASVAEGDAQGWYIAGTMPSYCGQRDAALGLVRRAVDQNYCAYDALHTRSATPENWFEDFGSGQLSGGAATITLDSAFAETVSTTADYHVFLTPRTRHLLRTPELDLDLWAVGHIETGDPFVIR